MFCSNCIKINNIINKFSLAGDNFIHDMHLRQSGFAYSACGLLTKKKTRTQKFKKTRDSM